MYFYKEIKSLTNAIGEAGLPQKLFEVAKKADIVELMKVVEEFEEKHPDICSSLHEFYSDYRNNEYPEIFTDDPEYDEKRFGYDPEEINPENLCALLAFSQGALSDSDLFLFAGVFEEAVRKYGQEEIANYLKEHCLENLIDLNHAFNPDEEETE